MKIKILTVPYIVTPNRSFRVQIKYPSGQLRKAILTEEHTFFCARSETEGKEIMIFWDKKHRFFGIDPSNAKEYFDIVCRSEESSEQLISKFRNPFIELLK